MKVGDRFDLPRDGVHGEVSWLLADEMTGELLSFVVAMDDGRFAAIDPSRLPTPTDTLQ